MKKNISYCFVTVVFGLFICSGTNFAQSPLSKIDPFVYTSKPDSPEQLLKTLPLSTKRVDVLIRLNHNYFGQPDKVESMLNEIKTLSQKMNYTHFVALFGGTIDLQPSAGEPKTRSRCLRSRRPQQSS